VLAIKAIKRRPQGCPLCLALPEHPVQVGLVTSLYRPIGNATGVKARAPRDVAANDRFSSKAVVPEGRLTSVCVTFSRSFTATPLQTIPVP